jgi:hypothetical protein
MKKTADVTGGKPIAVLLQSISGVSAINPLVAFYDIHGGKREVLSFYFVPDTTRDCIMYTVSWYVILTFVLVSRIVPTPADSVNVTVFYWSPGLICGTYSVYITILSPFISASTIIT